jgi:hypothetical protein
MNPNKKILFSFVGFFLVLVTIACSSGSLTPSVGTLTQDSNEPAVPGTTSTPVQSASPFIEQVASQTNIPAGESGTVIAACPSGSLMLGGGFASGEGMEIKKTMPDPAGWLVTGLNNSAEALSLTAYASCLHNDPGTIRIASADELVSGFPKAQCQAGEIITGGGFAYTTDSLEVYLSTPNGDSNNPYNVWSVQAVNHQSEDQPISVYALCLSQSSVTSTLVRDDKVAYVPGTTSTSVTLTCPAGAVMVAGGYEGTGATISRINPTDAGLWEVQVQGKTYFDGSLDHAVCLNLPSSYTPVNQSVFLKESSL